MNGQMAYDPNLGYDSYQGNNYQQPNGSFTSYNSYGGYNNLAYDQGGPFPASSRRDPLNEAYYAKSAPRSNSLAGSGFNMPNILKSKKKKAASQFDFVDGDDGDDGDDKDVPLPESTAAKKMNFTDITHIRDRGRYGGFDTMDTAPIIPTLESPLESLNKKNANNIQYRKAKSSQKKQMMNNIAKMNNSYQHNHNLLNPIGADPVGPHADSMASSGSFTSNMSSYGPAGGPRSMSLATGSAQRFPPNRQMPPRARNNFPPPAGAPRSMSFNNNPSNLNPMGRQHPNGFRGPPGQQRPPMPNGDPRAMSLQSGRLPPFAPKPIGPMNPLGPMGGPPNQRLGPGSRNGSLTNMQNPMNAPGPYGNGASRSGSFPNLQNPMAGPGTRSGSLQNLQNPMNGPPRNGSLSNTQNPMNNRPYGPGPPSAGPRMDSFTHQQNPMGPGGPRLNSLPNGPNPRFQEPRMNSLSNQPNPMYQNNNNQNGSINSFNKSLDDVPPPPPAKTAFDRAKTPSPKTTHLELKSSPQRNVNNSPKRIANSSPLRNINNSPLRNMNNSPRNISNSPARYNSSPKKSPFKAIDEPEDEDEEEQNKRISIAPSSGRIQSPPNRLYQRSSLSHELFPHGEDRPSFDPQANKTINESRNFDSRWKNIMDDSEPLKDLDSFNPYEKNFSSNEKNLNSNENVNPYEKIPDQKPIFKSPSYAVEDNYLDDSDEDTDVNYSAFDKVTKKEAETQKLPGNSSSSQELPKAEASPLYTKKAPRRKPPSASPVQESQHPYNSQEKSYESPLKNKYESPLKSQYDNDRVQISDSSPSKTQEKKNNFMAKLEASIDDSIGVLDDKDANANHNLAVGLNFDDHRMSRSNFKTLSPQMNDSTGFDNGNQGGLHGIVANSIHSNQNGNRMSVQDKYTEKRTNSVVSSESKESSFNNSANNSRNSMSGGSGIAGGFLKKLGLKKKSSINNNSSFKRKSSRNSKRESKTGGASFAMMKPNEKTNRSSVYGGQTDTTFNNKPNISVGSIDENGANSFSQRMMRNSANNTDDRSLEEKKAALFEKPKLEDDLFSESNIYKESSKTKENHINLETDKFDKSFGDSLSGAFDSIGNKLDKEFYPNDKLTKDQELVAKAEVENEYMKMTGGINKLNVKENKTAPTNGNRNSYLPKSAAAKTKKTVPITDRLNLSVEQLGILEANQSLINELQLMTKELTDSIQREVKLENDLRNYKLTLKTSSTSLLGGEESEVEALETEIRQKAVTISKLMTDLNEERRRRQIAEEHVLLYEKYHNEETNNGEDLPSALELNYEKSDLESQLIDKQDLINQQQQLIYQFDSEKLKIKENYSKIESENLNYKKKIIPDLTNEIELLRNHELQSSKRIQEKAKALKLENEQLKLELRQFKQNNLVESQRDALREALSSLKEQKDKELRNANERIAYLDSKVREYSAMVGAE